MAVTEPEVEDMKRRTGHEEPFVTVFIETWGDGVDTYDGDVLWELGPILSELGASGPIVSAGGFTGGPGATFSLPRNPEADIARFVASAVGMFETACFKLGLEHRGIARVDVMDARLQELELNQEPESYVGVTEIATILGVSRQRVAQLRERGDFPSPIAEIAAGPVWKRSSLNHFIREWPRKPGRPRMPASA